MKGIFSPHTDDAVFSLGEWMCRQRGVAIITPFAGIPPDGPGRRKHELLRHEHAIAAEMVGAEVINGDFLDDVYPPPDYAEFVVWVAEQFAKCDEVYIPLGIHHPDHVRLSDVLLKMTGPNHMNPVFIYQEQPYGVDYPELARQRLLEVVTILGPVEPIFTPTPSGRNKMAAVTEYQSQIDDSVIRRVMVPEKLWRVVR